MFLQMETNYGGKLNNTKVYGILLSCYIVYRTFLADKTSKRSWRTLLPVQLEGGKYHYIEKRLQTGLNWTNEGHLSHHDLTLNIGAITKWHNTNDWKVTD